VTRRVFDAYGQPDLDPNILASASHEIHDQFVDLSKAQPVLEWALRYGFEEGIAPTVAWHRQQAAAAGHRSCLLKSFRSG
jgi:nucleoside-diphosphate-sugar epimerase